MKARVVIITAAYIKKKLNKGSNFNSVFSFELGGGHIYSLSPVLVTLHSAEPLGRVASQMRSPVPSSH